jgi:glucose/arabinose dehydrogenase
VVALAATAGLATGLTACAGEHDYPSAASPGPPPVTASPRPTGTTSSADSPSTSPAPGGRVRVVRTLTTGLSVPWGVDFLPDGRAVVTERDSGRVLVVDPKSGQATRIGSIDMAAPNVEAGLLGVAVSPTFTDDHLLYFYVSTPEDNRIVRATWDGGLVAEPQTILAGIPLGPIHDGGRLAFGPDGYLYASTGETGDRDLSQDKASLAGKILRITADGEPAPGNPFGDSPIYSYGHRNVQGLAWDDADHLWASEFGDSTFDELNLIQPGHDYGWPIFEGRGDDPAYTNPKVVWSTEDASPSGLAYADGHLWLAALRGQRLWRVDVDNTTASNPTDFFVGNYGRLRTVVVAPDGRLWVTTSNKDGRGVPSPADDRILVVNPGAPR